jgi:uncharacterized protein YerC
LSYFIEELLTTSERLYTMHSPNSFVQELPHMRPISLAQRHTILRLLTDGYHHQEVSRLTGVSLATIARINKKQVKPRKMQLPDDAPPGYDVRRIRRCPGCGNKVYLWPCLECRLKGEVVYPPDLRPVSEQPLPTQNARIAQKSAA